MFFVIFNPDSKVRDEIDAAYNAVCRKGALRFSDYYDHVRRMPENRELFIAGSGTVITRLLERMAKEELPEMSRAVVFDEDIIARLDDEVEIRPLFEAILNRGVVILYHAKYDSTVSRLRESGLSLDIHVIDQIKNTKREKGEKGEKDVLPTGCEKSQK